MEVDADVDIVARRSCRSSANLLDGVLHLGRRLDVARRRGRFAGPGLERGEALRFMSALHLLRRARVRVDADPVARRPAEQFVHGHAERLALDVPQRLVDAAQRAGENRAAAIERVPVDRLPVMHHGARILADQVRLDLFDGRLRR